MLAWIRSFRFLDELWLEVQNLNVQAGSYHGQFVMACNSNYPDRHESWIGYQAWPPSSNPELELDVETNSGGLRLVWQTDANVFTSGSKFSREVTFRVIHVWYGYPAAVVSGLLLFTRWRRARGSRPVGFEVKGVGDAKQS